MLLSKSLPFNLATKQQLKTTMMEGEIFLTRCSNGIRSGAICVCVLLALVVYVTSGQRCLCDICVF